MPLSRFLLVAATAAALCVSPLAAASAGTPHAKPAHVRIRVLAAAVEPSLDPRYDSAPTPSGGETIPQEFSRWTGATGPDGWIPQWARGEWLRVAIAAGMAPDPKIVLPDVIPLGVDPLAFGVRFTGTTPGYWMHFDARALGTNHAMTGILRGLRWQRYDGGECVIHDGQNTSTEPCLEYTPGGYYLAGDCSAVDWGWIQGYWPPGTGLYASQPVCLSSLQQTIAAFDGAGRLYDLGHCCLSGGNPIIDPNSPHEFSWGVTYDELRSAVVPDSALALFSGQPTDLVVPFTPHYDGDGFRKAIAGASDAFRQLWDDALAPGDGGGGSDVTLTLTAVRTGHPFTGDPAQFSAVVGGVDDATGSTAQISVTGANSASLTTTIHGTSLAFEYVGYGPGTDTVVVSAAIAGKTVVSNPVTIRWLVGPHSPPFTYGPGGPNPFSKDPTANLADPVNSLTGNFSTTEHDAAVPGTGVPLTLDRTYNSLDATVGPFGRGWTASILPSLAFDDAGDVTVRSGTGRELAFRKETDGSFTPPDGALARLAAAPDGFVLTLDDATLQHYGADGSIRSWTDGNGNGLTFSWNGGELTSVSESGGGTVTFTYTGGHITSVALPGGAALTYVYDGDLLVAATDAAGKTTHYAYDASGRLTSITDPDGNVAVANVYDAQGRVVQQTDALGHVTTFAWDGDTFSTSDSSGATWTDTYDDGRLVARTDPLGDVTRFTYDAAFDVTSITDARGSTTRMTYDDRGNMLTRTYADGSSESWTYDDGNRVTSHTDPDGNTTRYAYDGDGNLVRVTTPTGGTTSYAVDAATGQPTSMTDPLGRTTAYAYDAAGDPTAITAPNGGRTTLQYDTRGRVVSSTDPLGRTTTFTYDGNGRLRSETDPLGETTTFAYDGNGRLLSRTDPAGHATRFEYDAAGHKTAAIAADGSKTTFAYDAAGNLVSTTDPLGRTTTYGYDAAGRRVAMTLPDGSTWRSGYDADGNRTSVTDPDGATTTTAYDSRNRPVESTSPLGATRRTEYDADGNVVATVDPLGGKTQLRYDALGDVVARVDPLGHTSSYAYDADGELTAATTPLGATTTYGYDALGALAAVTAPDGSATRYGYDAAGELISRTDANGHVTRWKYDDAGRTTALINPLGSTWTYGYDAAGNLVRTTTPSGGTVTRTVDALGRLVQLQYSDGTPTVSYAYDAAGERTQMQDGSGTVAYSYDAAGRLASVARGADAFTYAYDAAGRLSRRTAPGGFTTQLEYDADGRLVRVASPAGAFTYGYDAAGNQTSAALPNGIADSRAYDADGRVASIVDTSNGAVVSSRTYVRDADGNPTSVAAVSPRASWTDVYAYDSRDRVVQASGTAYTYDGVGNVLTRGSTRYTYDAADELVSAQGPGKDLSYRFDANGDEIQVGARKLTYDLAGRLVSARGGGAPASYTYDGDGNVLTRSTNKTLQFVWDTNGPLPALALERSGSTPVRTYTDGTSASPLAVTTPSGSSAYLTDALGSVVEQTDATGSSTASFRYDAFGATLSGGDPEQTPIEFAGQYFDAANGLYLDRARQYDPSVGRFLEPDPLAAPAGVPAVAPYVYADDRPTVLTDPSGQFPVLPGDSIAHAAAQRLAYDQVRASLFVHGFSPSSDVELEYPVPGGGRYGTNGRADVVAIDRARAAAAAWEVKPNNMFAQAEGALQLDGYRAGLDRAEGLSTDNGWPLFAGPEATTDGLGRTVEVQNGWFEGLVAYEITALPPTPEPQPAPEPQPKSPPVDVPVVPLLPISVPVVIEILAFA